MLPCLVFALSEIERTGFQGLYLQTLSLRKFQGLYSQTLSLRKFQGLYLQTLSREREAHALSVPEKGDDGGARGDYGSAVHESPTTGRGSPLPNIQFRD